MAFAFFGILATAVAAYLASVEDASGPLSLLASVATACLPLAESLHVYGATDMRTLAPLAILMATAFIESYTRFSCEVREKALGALGFHALRCSLVATAVVSTAPGGLAAGELGNSLLSAIMIAFMVALVIAMFFDINCGRLQFGACTIVAVILLNVGSIALGNGGRLEVTFPPFTLMTELSGPLSVGLLLLGSCVLADEGRLLPRSTTLLFGVLVAGCLGNLFLALGIALVLVLSEIGAGRGLRNALPAVVLLAGCALACFRLYPMLGTELAFWLNPHVVLGVLPVRILTASGGLMGAGIEAASLSVGPAIPPDGGVYALAAHFARLGVLGSLGVVGPWAISAFVAVKKVLAGRLSTIAAALIAIGLGVVACTLVCWGVIPPLTTGGPFACVGDVMPLGELVLFFVAWELDSLAYDDDDLPERNGALLAAAAGEEATAGGEDATDGGAGASDVGAVRPRDADAGSDVSGETGGQPDGDGDSEDEGEFDPDSIGINWPSRR